MAVFDKIKDMIVDNFGIDAGDVKPEADFVEDLGLDSLDATELIMEAQSEFDIEIEDEVAQSLKTVGDIVSYIEKNTK